MASSLLALHADDGVLQAEGLHQNAHAADDPLALLQHQPVVSGYVGLTLGAVQIRVSTLPTPELIFTWVGKPRRPFR